jgi:hypothetical protein
VPCARGGVSTIDLLDIVRHDDAGDGALGHGDAHRAIDQMAHLLGCGAHVDVLAGHVLEQRDEIDLLLVMAAERGALLLADDRDDRSVIELGVVKAVQEMDRARPGGRHADPRPAGELGMRAGHERRDLLVRHLDELEAVLGAAQGAEDAVDPIARIAVDPPDAPLRQPLQHEIADGPAHVFLRICQGRSRRQAVPRAMPGKRKGGGLVASGGALSDPTQHARRGRPGPKRGRRS